MMTLIIVMVKSARLLAVNEPLKCIDTVFDYKQVFKDYCINDDRGTDK